MNGLGELIGTIQLGDVSFFGLLALAIILILTGKLVPKSTVDEIRQDRNDALTDIRGQVNDWREAYQTSEAARLELGAQVRELLEYAKTSDHLIRSIQNGERRDGAP